MAATHRLVPPAKYFAITVIADVFDLLLSSGHYCYFSGLLLFNSTIHLLLVRNVYVSNTHKTLGTYLQVFGMTDALSEKVFEFRS